MGLGISGLEGTSDHELDATTAAYISKLFLEGVDVYGGASDGIVLPKKKKI